MAPLYLRVSVDNKRSELSLKRSVHLNDWDQRRNVVIGSSTEAKMLNRFIDHVKKKVLEAYHHLTVSGIPVSCKAIKNLLQGLPAEEPEPPNTLMDLFAYHHENNVNILKPDTLGHYETTRKYVEKFLMHKKKKKDIALDELKYRFITEFDFFLRNYKPKDHRKPLTNNGIMKHLERLRKIAKLGVRLDWMEKDPFPNFKMKYKKFEREYLDNRELDNIEDLEIDIFRLELVRDLFIFSCYTGLAYSDVMELTHDQISKGIDGNEWIIKQRKKTDTKLRIPLLKKAKQIIEDYEGHPRTDGTDRVFPKISNQKLNAYLKEIADLAGINKNLTFHLARHTFATLVTLQNGVPIETVSRLLGHTNIQTTQIYAKVMEQKIAQDFAALKSRLEPESYFKIKKAK